LVLISGQVQGDPGGSSCLSRSPQGVGILPGRMQRVADILKGDQDRAALVFGSLSIGGLRGAFLMPQGAGVKNGLDDSRGQIPKPIPP